MSARMDANCLRVSSRSRAVSRLILSRRLIASSIALLLSATACRWASTVACAFCRLSLSAALSWLACFTSALACWPSCRLSPTHQPPPMPNSKASSTASKPQRTKLLEPAKPHFFAMSIAMESLLTGNLPFRANRLGDRPAPASEESGAGSRWFLCAPNRHGRDNAPRHASRSHRRPHAAWPCALC